MVNFVSFCRNLKHAFSVVYYTEESFMLDFILCDDNLNALKRLEKILESVFINKNLEAQIVLSTTEPGDLMVYLKNHSVHVVILDIDLKAKVSGLDLANLIRKQDKNVYIIFTTGHLEYGLLAYKYKTFDYLSKPVTVERLEETIDRLIDDMAGNVSQFVRLDNNKTIINQDGIQYIQKDGMKVIFHTDTRDYETYSSFKKILPQLPSQFVQCHKSYIVNTKKITDVDMSNNSICLNNDQTIKCYIGPKYKNQFMEVFNHGNFSNNLDSINNTK